MPWQTYRILWEKWPEALFLGRQHALPVEQRSLSRTCSRCCSKRGVWNALSTQGGWLILNIYVNSNSKAVRRGGVVVQARCGWRLSAERDITVMIVLKASARMILTKRLSGKKGHSILISEHARRTEYYRKGCCCTIDAKTPPE